MMIKLSGTSRSSTELANYEKSKIVQFVSGSYIVEEFAHSTLNFYSCETGKIDK
jgi:hypothetical protein